MTDADLISHTVAIVVSQTRGLLFPEPGSSELQQLIRDTYATLASLGSPPQVLSAGLAPKTPAEIRKSIKNDVLVSFEDGKPYKMLRRHLTKKGLTPEQYREKHGLPADYPMVAPAYTEQRRNIAKKVGLGHVGRNLHGDA